LKVIDSTQEEFAALSKVKMEVRKREKPESATIVTRKAIGSQKAESVSVTSKGQTGQDGLEE
jgi:outer membrane receptor for ferric coprogen and ferric-rhodotorulic acid